MQELLSVKMAVVGTVDNEEIRTIEVNIPRPRQKYTIEGGYGMSALVATEAIAMMDLTRSQLRVWLYLVGNLKWDNRVAVTQKEIAGRLGIPQPEVSRCCTALRDHGMLKIHRESGREAVYELSTRYVVYGQAAIVRANQGIDFAPTIVPPPPPEKPGNTPILSNTQQPRF